MREVYLDSGTVLKFFGRPQIVIETVRTQFPDACCCGNLVDLEIDHSRRDDKVRIQCKACGLAIPYVRSNAEALKLWEKMTKERIKEVLSKMGNGMNSKYWGSNGEIGLAGTSQKVFTIIYRKLASYLESGNERKARNKRPFEL